MKKMILSLSFVLCSSFTGIKSHDHHDHHQHMLSSKADAPKVLPFSSPLYVQPYSVRTGSLVVKQMEIKGFSGASLEKLDKAFELLEVVVNTEEFKNRVINFVNKKGERQFASNKKLSNEEIFKIFMSGEETLQPTTTGEMNYFVSLYNARFSKVVGWTNAKINTINVNWKFFKNYEANDVAGNLAHEWTHKIGFDHASASEHDSAPYAIGYIVREMGERYLKGEELH